MRDVIVVGDGIFGRVIARHLHECGLDVELVGDSRPYSGSQAAGCVIKPSWVSTMSRGDLEEGLRLLDQYYGLRDVEFRLRPSGLRTSAFRVEPTSILHRLPALVRVTCGVVTGITESGDAVLVHGRSALGNALTRVARRVVVTAGVWTPELCPWVEVTGKWGWSFRGPGIVEPTIKPWAPYRQVVALNLDDGRSWSGDGSALVERSVTSERMRRALERCREVVQTQRDWEMLPTLGVRPYASTREPCLVSRRGNVVAVTGGAKNGTIAAAWAAGKVLVEVDS